MNQVSAPTAEQCVDVEIDYMELDKIIEEGGR